MVPDSDPRQPIRRSARTRSAGLAVVAALAVLGASHLAARAGLQLQDAPSRHSDWIDEGLALDASPGDASIRGGHLSVGAGTDLQGVRWREPQPLDSLEFSVLCPADRHLDIWFSQAGEGRVGVRLSRRGSLPSAWWVQGPDGLQSESREFYPPRLVDWTRVQVRFDAGGAFDVTIRGREVLKGRSPVVEPSGFGFRSGGGEVLVDDVRLTARDGAVTPVDFANHEHEGWAHAVSLLLLLALGVGAGRLIPASSRWVPALGVAVMVALLAYVIEGLDARSAAAPVPSEGPAAAELTDALASRFAEPGPPGGRVLFLGTGQTRGAGASVVARGWVEQVCRGWNAQVPSEPPAFECVNAGLVGSSSSELWKLYRDQWSKLAPDLVVANLGHGESAADLLAVNAERLVVFNEQRGVATWFLIEPTGPGDPTPESEAAAEALRAVSREYGLAPPSELPRAFADEGGGKHMWWAPGSPTDQGHRLIARRVLADGAAVAASLGGGGLRGRDGGLGGRGGVR